MLTKLASKITCLFRRSHDYHTKCEEDWTFLQCGRCGSRTVGWRVEPAFSYYEDTRETFRLDFAEDAVPGNVVSLPVPDRQVSLRLEYPVDSQNVA